MIVPSMKILCVIDSLGSGGAQRQMVNLACGLKAKGHSVELLVYFPDLRFFRADVDAACITVHEVYKNKGFSLKVLGKIVNLMRSSNCEAVISFLHTPNIYVELARFFSRSTARLIVSERSSYIRETGSITQKISRYLHVLADAVVANSYTHAKWLSSHDWLRDKTHVIYNGYPLIAIKRHNYSAAGNQSTNFLIAGRIDAGKNGIRLLEALVLFNQRNGYTPSISWAGRQEIDAESLKVRAEMDRILTENPQISGQWHWLGERNDIPQLMENCDALIHVSLFEGLPNVVCEAFIAGRPVIASNVCDHPFLVEDGVRGVLCDPLLPFSICAAIERFTSLSSTERLTLGQNARKYFEENLSIDRMVSAYESLLFRSDSLIMSPQTK